MVRKNSAARTTSLPITRNTAQRQVPSTPHLHNRDFSTHPHTRKPPNTRFPEHLNFIVEISRRIPPPTRNTSKRQVLRATNFIVGTSRHPPPSSHSQSQVPRLLMFTVGTFRHIPLLTTPSPLLTCTQRGKTSSPQSRRGSNTSRSSDGVKSGSHRI